ncbi:DUF2806 domain-containing protein [Vibrio parahaemolyticus]|uniref:DUF2806 domain-containing protein n=1 Tax=Vibrio parahaemolyticus TaxID=670 RepID=A0A9Q3UFB7_VIBPH|nr:DUF2806 domain-containing protein [Vibrio parahaemolyticus]EJB8438977.1 DUF2806 domain-containing protein [Vibrio parahaemolyticus]ELZ7200604.1 DUF2806 domain-containing protein [Vibrio parahaemolyticus]MCC3807684.1 DUF2806 domain-containing protein [Vibrio parahaemolyticus]HBC3530121.1 DUF2806 domain-containing protein [Vibrio parahaemolyticus]
MTSSLINFELTKPATLLIEKVSDAIGVLYEPTRIARRSKAESDAAVRDAETRVKVSEIEQGALDSFLYRESRKHQNMESITAQAVEQIQDKDNSSPEELDLDWLTYFFEHCSNVSDKEMQFLWASLLASEASRPGSFSKKSIQFISLLEKSDAELFTSLCQFVFIDRGYPQPVILNFRERLYNERGINENSLRYLDEIGLVKCTEGNHAVKVIDMRGAMSTTMSYFGTSLSLSINEESISDSSKPIRITTNHLEELKNNPCPTNGKVNLGTTSFTRIGVELYRLCSFKKNDDFYRYITDEYRKNGVVVTES